MITNEASSEPWVCVVAMRNAVITQACQGSWWTLPRLSRVLSIMYEMFLCLHKLILPYIFSFLKHFRLEDILPTAYQNSNNLSFFVNNNHFCFTDLYKKVWKTYMWKFLMRYFILLFLLFFYSTIYKMWVSKNQQSYFYFFNNYVISWQKLHWTPESNTSWGNSLVVIESSDLVNLYKVEVRSF